MAHVHCMLDTEGYKHTLRTCIIYCFSLQQWLHDRDQFYVVRTFPLLLHICIDFVL